MSDIYAAYVAEEESKRRAGTQLRHKNLLLFAERLGWPDGAVEVCRRVENEHPPWLAMWTGAGFQAWRTGSHWTTRYTVTGADEAELLAAIRATRVR